MKPDILYENFTKGKDYNDTKLCEILLNITNDNYLFKDNYEIVFTIRKKSKSLKQRNKKGGKI